MNAPRPSMTMVGKAFAPIIAIDGPAASGKGTLARRLAQTLSLPYLDTGLLYRAVAWRVLSRQGNPADDVSAAQEARALTPDDLHHAELRGEIVGQAASIVAAQPQVRAALLTFQRSFGGQNGAVLDGRDVGTVIFPDADVKLFVTANVTIRAERRFRELQSRGQDTTLALVEADLRARDERDAQRAEAPMRIADDAWLLDTSVMDANQAFEAALKHVTDNLHRDR